MPKYYACILVILIIIPIINMIPVKNSSTNKSNSDENLDDDINFNGMPQLFAPIKPFNGPTTTTRKNNNNILQLPNSALTNILETLSILMNDTKGQKNTAYKDTFG